MVFFGGLMMQIGSCQQKNQVLSNAEELFMAEGVLFPNPLYGLIWTHGGKFQTPEHLTP